MICLIRVPAVETFRFATTSITPPLGLAYIAGAIEASGRQVHVIDAVGAAPTRTSTYVKGFLVGLPLPEIVERVPAAAKVVGISVIFTHEWPAAARLIALLKAARPDVTIVLGGEHVSAMAEFCLATAPADVVVLGEGEETIVNLLDALEGGQDHSAVPGTAVRTGDRIVVNPRRARRQDVDAIARPAWHHFDLPAYHANRFVGGMDSEHLTVPILATRGCPYQCTYCAAPRMWSPRWIPRDPIQVVDEIQHYIETVGAGNFPFQDLTAILKKEWIIAFCTEIKRRGLSFTWLLPTGTRVEAVDDNVSRLLAETGMVSMAFAPESGSDTTRRLVRKKMNADHLFQSVDSAGKAGLNVALFLVIGFPHETAAQMDENLPFIDRLRATAVRDLSVGFYMALPGTELFDSLYDAGAIHIDRAWFRHILDSNALLPSMSVAPDLGRLGLARQKLKMYWRFYGGKRPGIERKSLFTRLREVFAGLKDRQHASRLQTALANGLRSGLNALIARTRAPWMDPAEEARLFAGWDDIYHSIRQQRITAGASQPAPADSAQLHQRNVVQLIRAEHGTRFEMPAAERT